MWIVRLALRRPYTFIVMALLIVMLGIKTPKTNPAANKEATVASA